MNTQNGKRDRKEMGKLAGVGCRLFGGSSVRLMRRQDLYTITSFGSLRLDVGLVNQIVDKSTAHNTQEIFSFLSFPRGASHNCP